MNITNSAATVNIINSAATVNITNSAVTVNITNKTSVHLQFLPLTHLPFKIVTTLHPNHYKNLSNNIHITVPHAGNHSSKFINKKSYMVITFFFTRFIARSNYHPRLFIKINSNINYVSSFISKLRKGKVVP